MSTVSYNPYDRQKNVVTIQERPDAVRKTLLAATVITATLTLFSPLRFVACLGGRSIALMSSLYNASTAEGSWKQVALQVAFIVPVLLGIAGVLAGKKLLILSSLALSIGLRLFEAGAHFLKGRVEQGVESVIGAVINGIALAAIMAASWQLMVLAAGAGFLYLAVKSAIAAKRGDDFSAGCLATLSLLSLVTMGMTIRMQSRRVSRMEFKHKNKSDEVETVARKGHRYVVVPSFSKDSPSVFLPAGPKYNPIEKLKPGESYHGVFDQKVNVVVQHANGEETTLVPSHVETKLDVYQPIVEDDYPQVFRPTDPQLVVCRSEQSDASA